MRKFVVGTAIALIVLVILIFVVPVKVSVNVSWDEPVTVVQMAEALKGCGPGYRFVRRGGEMETCIINGKKCTCRFVWNACELKPPSREPFRQ